MRDPLRGHLSYFITQPCAVVAIYARFLMSFVASNGYGGAMNLIKEHLGDIFALATALSWALGVIWFRKSQGHFSAPALNFFKNIVGIVLLTITIVATGRWDALELEPEAIALMVASGALGIGVADTMFFECLERLGASRTAVVECLYSPVVILFSGIFLEEVMGLSLLMGCGLIVGSIILVERGRKTDGVEEHTRSRAELTQGLALGIASMLFMGLAVVLVKPVIERADLLWSTELRLLGGILGGLVYSGWRKEVRGAWRASLRPSVGWKYAIPGAFVGTYLSLIFWLGGFKYGDASSAAALNQTSTVFTVILAALILKEKVGFSQWIAISLGFLGSLIVVSSG